MVSDNEGGHKFSASGSRTEHGHVNDALVYRQGNYGCHCGGHSDITSGVSQRSARYITCNTSGRGGGGAKDMSAPRDSGVRRYRCFWVPNT